MLLLLAVYREIAYTDFYRVLFTLLDRDCRLDYVYKFCFEKTFVDRKK